MQNFESNPNPYKCSLANIVSTMQGQATEQQITLGRVFTLVYQFERRVDLLKQQLFSQPEVDNHNNLQLLNTVFKAVDRSRCLALSAEDIQHFVETQLQVSDLHAYARLVQLFGGQARLKLVGQKTFQSYEKIHFSDLLMIIQPAALFELRHAALFQNRTPQYDNRKECSQKTLSLIAQIFCMYLTFIQDMSDICKSNPMPINELFDSIAKGKDFFTTQDLFSFILSLPVIFTIEDTDVICRGLMLDKQKNSVFFDDFRLIVMPDQRGQRKHTQSWQQTTCQLNNTRQTPTLMFDTGSKESNPFCNTIQEGHIDIRYPDTDLKNQRTLTPIRPLSCSSNQERTDSMKRQLVPKLWLNPNRRVETKDQGVSPLSTVDLKQVQYMRPINTLETLKTNELDKDGYQPLKIIPQIKRRSSHKRSQSTVSYDSKGRHQNSQESNGRNRSVQSEKRQRSNLTGTQIRQNLQKKFKIKHKTQRSQACLNQENKSKDARKYNNRDSIHEKPASKTRVSSSGVRPLMSSVVDTVKKDPICVACNKKLQTTRVRVMQKTEKSYKNYQEQLPQRKIKRVEKPTIKRMKSARCISRSCKTDNKNPLLKVTKQHMLIDERVVTEQSEVELFSPIMASKKQKLQEKGFTAQTQRQKPLRKWVDVQCKGDDERRQSCAMLPRQRKPLQPRSLNQILKKMLAVEDELKNLRDVLRSNGVQA